MLEPTAPVGRERAADVTVVAVVAIDRVVVAEPLPSVKVVGEKEQVASVGSPEHENKIDAGFDPDAFTVAVTVMFADCPAVTCTFPGVALRL